jgi:hypothetical protein
VRYRFTLPFLRPDPIPISISLLLSISRRNDFPIPRKLRGEPSVATGTVNSLGIRMEGSILRTKVIQTNEHLRGDHSAQRKERRCRKLRLKRLQFRGLPLVGDRFATSLPTSTKMLATVNFFIASLKPVMQPAHVLWHAGSSAVAFWNNLEWFMTLRWRTLLLGFGIGPLYTALPFLFLFLLSSSSSESSFFSFSSSLAFQ